MNSTAIGLTDNPTDIIRHRRFVELQRSILDLLELSTQLGEAQILGVDGAKGVGVTTLIKDFCTNYPRAVEVSPSAPLLVTTPMPVNILALGREILRCYDDPLADDYSDMGVVNRKLIQYVGSSVV